MTSSDYIRRPVPAPQRQDPPLERKADRPHLPFDIQQRKAEAERIAAAEGFGIRDHEDDWSYFTLDDGLLVEEGPMAGQTIYTHFEWVRESRRFEGFVS